MLVPDPFNDFIICTLFASVLEIKNIHRRQKLTTDFDYFGCEYLNFEKKNMLTVVSRGLFFKGLDNKIIGFLHI